MTQLHPCMQSIKGHREWWWFAVLHPCQQYLSHIVMMGDNEQLCAMKLHKSQVEFRLQQNLNPGHCDLKSGAQTTLPPGRFRDWDKERNQTHLHRSGQMFLFSDKQMSDIRWQWLFYVPFNIIQVISRQWKDDNERVCTMQCWSHELISV